MTTVTPPRPDRDRRRRRLPNRTDKVFLALGVVAMLLVLVGVVWGGSSPWWFAPPVVVIAMASWSLRR